MNECKLLPAARFHPVGGEAGGPGPGGGGTAGNAGGALRGGGCTKAATNTNMRTREGAASFVVAGAGRRRQRR